MSDTSLFIFLSNKSALELLISSPCKFFYLVQMAMHGYGLNTCLTCMHASVSIIYIYIYTCVNYLPLQCMTASVEAAGH